MVSKLAAHPITRALSRYGVTLTRPELRALELQIAERRSVLVSRLPHGHERHLVRHGEIVMLAVATDALVPTIVTFLGPETMIAGHSASRYGGAKKVRNAHRRARRKEKA